MFLDVDLVAIVARIVNLPSQNPGMMEGSISCGLTLD